jgi:hypothetical protein
MTQRDPVSWFLIEPGWKVLDADGDDVGTVDEVVGDSGNDIFNGLSISPSLLGRPRYIPSEEVAEIVEGQVRLTLSKDAFERLGEFEEPPTTAEILPDEAGAFRRAEAAVDAPIHAHGERVNLLTRVRHAFRRRFGR